MQATAKGLSLPPMFKNPKDEEIDALKAEIEELHLMNGHNWVSCKSENQQLRQLITKMVCNMEGRKWASRTLETERVALLKEAEAALE